MSLYVVHERPELDRPVLVMAPEGWIDAGLGGGAALGTLLTAIETTVVANFDIDELLDHRARRPTARITDGVYEDLMWPEIELRAGHDASGNAVLLLVGPEPDHQWRAYAAALAEVAQLFDVRVLVAVERRFAEAGIPAIGLWARVPHYAAAMPYPEASLLLLQGLADVAGITVDTTPLREAADATRERLDELIANSAEHSALVRQLEARADAEAEPTPEGWGDLPSGDELAAEFERFLQSGEGQ